MLDETYEITAIGYNENWYGDEAIEEVFTVDYIFDGLLEIKERLYEGIKKYVGKIRPFIIEQYILKQVTIYNNYFTHFFIKWLKQLDEEIVFKDMPKGNTLQVTFGEYKNNSQIVYFYDDTEKTEVMFKEKLKSNKKEEMIFSVRTGLEASGIKLENKDISCINIKESKLNNIVFSSCTAIGLNLKKATLTKCHFKECDLGMSDFTESILEEVIFENCVLRNTEFKSTNFKNVYVVEGETVKKLSSRE